MKLLIQSAHERELDRRCNDRKITGDELELRARLREWMASTRSHHGKLFQDLEDQFDVCEADDQVRRAELSAQMSEGRAALWCREREAAE